MKPQIIDAKSGRIIVNAVNGEVSIQIDHGRGLVGAMLTKLQACQLTTALCAVVKARD